MNAPCLILLTTLGSHLSAQTANEAMLTFVDLPDANNFGVSLNVTGIGPSNDTSKISGTMNVRVNLSAATATTNELTILSADAAATDVTLSARSFAGNYNCSASNLRLTIATPLPPGIVNPATREFDASQHQATTTQGNVAVTANTLLGSENLNYDLLADPFTGSGQGTGTIEVTPGRIENHRLYFDLKVNLPVNIVNTTPVPNTPITATFVFTGLAEATGETFLEFPDYAAWAATHSLSPDSQNNFNFQPDTPNYLFYALGFDPQTAPAQLFDISSSEATLVTGGDIALGDLEIQWSDDLDTWVRVPENAMESGNSRLTFGDPLSEPPTINLDGTRKFLRLVRPVIP